MQRLRKMLLQHFETVDMVVHPTVSSVIPQLVIRVPEGEATVNVDTLTVESTVADLAERVSRIVDLARSGALPVAPPSMVIERLELETRWRREEEERVEAAKLAEEEAKAAREAEEEEAKAREVQEALQAAVALADAGELDKAVVGEKNGKK
eukprot:GABV01009444.1.p2 GENE.GABV01009444.1~~GABV01009444.1.p2  ORF type:complete len:152 (-),score=40.44 GABV01009444.1:8-463(-)